MHGPLAHMLSLQLSCAAGATVPARPPSATSATPLPRGAVAQGKLGTQRQMHGARLPLLWPCPLPTRQYQTSSSEKSRSMDKHSLGSFQHLRGRGRAAGGHCAWE